MLLNQRATVHLEILSISCLSSPKALRELSNNQESSNTQQQPAKGCFNVQKAHQQTCSKGWGSEKDLDLKFSRISKILRNPKAEAKTKMESLRVRTSALLFHRVTSTNHLCVAREAYTAHPLSIIPPPWDHHFRQFSCSIPCSILVLRHHICSWYVVMRDFSNDECIPRMCKICIQIQRSVFRHYPSKTRCQHPV